jgi:hypothetical protein
VPTGIGKKAADIESLRPELETFRPSYNIATIATDHRGEVIADIFPCRD